MPRHRAHLRRERALRWLATLLAAATLALWALTFWAWIDLSIGGVALQIGHGSLTIDQTDDSFSWPTTGQAFPARVLTLGEHCTIACTWLDDLPGYALADRWGFMKWRPDCGSVATLLGSAGTPRRWYLDIPLWIPILLTTGAAALAWKRRLRHKTPEELAACPRCGYDLRGLNEHAICPECAAGR